MENMQTPHRQTKETQHINQQNVSRDVAVWKTLEPHYYVVSQHIPEFKTTEISYC